MSIRTLLISSLALAPLCACAVAAVGAAGAVGVATVQDRTYGEALDAAAASNAIKARLLTESSERFSGVDVEVTGGLVLLSGRVSSPEDRVFAEGVAWKQRQIDDVANEIQIASPGGFFSNASDELITARVRSRLIGSSTVKSVNFNIETYSGVVYLMGIARNQAELQQAAEKASTVGGVKQVVSYVEIREPRNAASTPAGGPATAPVNDGELEGGPASYQ